LPRRQAFFVNYGTTNRNFRYICPQKPKKISQKVINQVIPETQKALDEGLAEIRKMMKEHPELAAQLKDQLKEAEAQRGKLIRRACKRGGRLHLSARRHPQGPHRHRHQARFQKSEPHNPLVRHY